MARSKNKSQPESTNIKDLQSPQSTSQSSHQSLKAGQQGLLYRAVTSQREPLIPTANDDAVLADSTCLASDAVAPGEPSDAPKTRYSHTFRIHNSIRASPLSKESLEQNFRGFFNLSMLLLGVSNLRLIVENFQKYGWLLNLPSSGFSLTDVHMAILSIIFQIFNVLVAFSAEKCAAHYQENTYVLWFIQAVHAANISATIIVPTWISWSFIWHPVTSSIPLFLATTLFLKLISYALVNADLRHDVSKDKSKTAEDMVSLKHQPLTGGHSQNVDANIIPYPENINLDNMLYFIVAPTLCYQQVYPRTKRIRKMFLFKRFVELSTSLAGMFFLTMQYAAPTLRNSIEALENMDMLRLLERMLKLSVVSVVIWLLMFWSFFHCWLNILAELTCFGDRRFYQPWWNARDISEYWRLWNSPVYNWGKRHIYLPLILNLGFHPYVALAVVFCISALLHELLVAVPTHCLNGVAFLGMMGQVPLIFIVGAIFTTCRKVLGRPKNDALFDTIGNYVFWITFTIVGQPACILVYYTQWFKANNR
ncbi:hypothetical protein BATDEDRAFT_34607 [Batrachochytrium dendrobatidis JAM81]|uniref:O-acyltransferase n=1 Tax=Batrachochytrium dendrobatidis (strain JAM81 / FGSC 10211) TaxID=684364 RepID=F4NZ71_BATDJ|nr:uncharacterized protein BATDEDRAFT_34607 [Batrachochytrium dendrobatidis JAM81]EGF82147.1 hypothetical protein BATDEDRAFT_34607 [Batrachochytrium dendrobatidis JAM81]KAJ8324634.1 hypothetical protein O5D80_006882 [Batrachochytrium dendrobatidis]KAK5670886.1 hypothetical protein QVD99_002658 [Batrachochytrium dendrobatidis]|eukprot:XP_006677426.1 hypothetical protein BATDEDRAFT_34607 [Batrachochytrium dendrobatidis JAM81]